MDPYTTGFVQRCRGLGELFERMKGSILSSFETFESTEILRGEAEELMRRPEMGIQKSTLQNLASASGIVTSLYRYLRPKDVWRVSEVLLRTHYPIIVTLYNDVEPYCMTFPSHLFLRLSPTSRPQVLLNMRTSLCHHSNSFLNTIFGDSQRYFPFADQNWDRASSVEWLVDDEVLCNGYDVVNINADVAKYEHDVKEFVAYADVIVVHISFNDLVYNQPPPTVINIIVSLQLFAHTRFAKLFKDPAFLMLQLLFS